LRTPAAAYYDPAYARGKCLRYAEDSAGGIIGPQRLAERLREEIATFVGAELRLERNREKTQGIPLPTEKARL
jgi:hypothetical protein